MKVTGNGAAAVSREAERITQNGINGVNRGTTKPIVSAKSGIIPSSSASEINRAAQERAAHSQAKADFVSIPLDALNSAGAWLDKGLTNLAGRIDASWAGEGVGDAAEWITEKEKLANEKACAAYKHCINGLQELLPNSDVERILGGSGLILVGGFKMTGGAILTLAGAATSHLGIGFGGITAGTITGLSGVSDIEQGINEIKLGLRNDRTTRTGNYVRDTLYDGNDTIYHLSTGMAMMAGMALKPYVIPRKNPVLAGGEQKDIAKKAAMGADEAAGEVTNPNALQYDGNGNWTSNEGLVYGQGSKDGNRVRHILQHTQPNPAKPVHTVFNVDKSVIVGLIDEAWINRGTGMLQSNGNICYDINMGRAIGTNGETTIRIITQGYTNNIITAYPK